MMTRNVATHLLSRCATLWMSGILIVAHANWIRYAYCECIRVRLEWEFALKSHFQYTQLVVWPRKGTQRRLLLWRETFRLIMRDAMARCELVCSWEEVPTSGVRFKNWVTQKYISWNVQNGRDKVGLFEIWFILLMKLSLLCSCLTRIVHEFLKFNNY